MTADHTRMTRRRFMRAAGAGLALAAAPGCMNKPRPPHDDARIPVIDTHTHFYDPARPQGVPWPAKDDPFLYRTVLPPEYEAVARPLGVTGTVVVEASPWVEDNQWVLDLAARDPFIVGVVGNRGPGDDDFPAHLARFAKDPLFRGIRLRDRPWRQRLEDARFTDDLRRLADADLQLDINGGPADLPDVARLAERAPGLRIVVDHCGNVPIDGGLVKPDWLAGMRAVAARPNTWCKVSGLVEGTGRQKGDAPADVDYYRPVLDALWEVFGERRLIYGSNWPVSARFAPLERVQGIVERYVAAKGRDAAERVFWRNAKDAYRWSSSSPL